MFISYYFETKIPSVYMTVSISVERYVAIFYPLVYKVTPLPYQTSAFNLTRM